MGMYTEVITDVVLQGLPPEGLEWLRWVCRPSQGGKYWYNYPEPPGPRHKFFEASRRTFIFHGAPRPKEATLEQQGDQVRVRASASIKNYRGEIQDWIDWISSYVTVGKVSHRYEYEEWHHEILVRKDRATGELP